MIGIISSQAYSRMGHAAGCRRVHITLLVVMVVVCSSSSARAGAYLQGLGFVEGETHSSAGGVSADGTTVVGYSGSRAFYWTAVEGMVPFGPVNSRARGVSADGSVIVGETRTSAIPTPNFEREAFRWTHDGGFVRLGDLPGGNIGSRARAVSADGNVVVGEGDATFVGAPTYHPFRWTASTGMRDLGALSSSSVENLVALGASGDGSVVVGVSARGSDEKAFRWTPFTGLVSLDPGGTHNSSATVISTDGNVIAGFWRNDDHVFEPFRWTVEDGFRGLGVTEGLHPSRPQGITEDGAIIVGGGGGVQGFIWNEESGVVPLTDYFTSLGIDHSDWATFSASGISADGNVITGTGFRPDGTTEAWVAVVPEPSSLSLLVGLLFVLVVRRRVGS